MLFEESSDDTAPDAAGCVYFVSWNIPYCILTLKRSAYNKRTRGGQQARAEETGLRVLPVL